MSLKWQQDFLFVIQTIKINNYMKVSLMNSDPPFTHHQFFKVEMQSEIRDVSQSFMSWSCTHGGAVLEEDPFITSNLSPPS